MSPGSIVKRDGRTEPFRPEKIAAAVLKAFRAVGVGDAGPERERPGEAERRAREIADIVTSELAARGAAAPPPTVEEVQDLVERTLIEERLPEPAKAYILYRRRRAELREAKKLFGVEKDDLGLTVNAIKVLERRYLRKDEHGRVVETPAGMMRRVAREVAAPEARFRGPEAAALIEERFEGALRRLRFLPNSPTLMNAGTDIGQLAACYVLPVEDSVAGIFDSLKRMALIHQSGGGTGFSFSRLRPKNDVVRSTGGVASGPVSFIHIFDSATEVIKQGGRRRGANMAILRVDHPDILEFIASKAASERTFRNFNISVGVTDAFMEAVEAGKTYALRNPRTGEVVRELPARDVFDLIVAMAWQCGDPGLVFLDTINRTNPTADQGEIEATNPCFAGHVRLATDRGLLTFEELYREQCPIRVLTDDRVLSLRERSECGGGAAVKVQAKTGVTLRPAKPVFKTRRDWPVFRLETEHGFEVTATADHEFFTPDGTKELRDLRPGDELLIQSGPGVWSSDPTLPPFVPERKLAGRIARGEARPPKRWSRELGELLGWVVGEGWVSAETPVGRTVPNYTVGLMFGDEEKKLLAPKLRALIGEWLGLKGCAIERNGTLAMFYKSALYYFQRSLGLKHVGGLEKEVPDSLWRAPREAVLGFLSALFTSDGTVNVAARAHYGSIRLANSSKKLLQQVQLLLANEGIVSGLYLRRKASMRLMPDSHRKPKLYACADQYELIITRTNRTAFIRRVGFLTSSKQKKAQDFEATTECRGARREPFVTRVKRVSSVGAADVYCTTEPETRSIVVNTCIAANCGEQPLHPFEACNLGSVNLARMTRSTADGRVEVDWDLLGETVELGVHFLDNVIEAARYPLPEIERVVKGNRRIGLGVMGFAELLLLLRIPYTAPAALELAERIMAFVQERAHKRSRELALERGSFPAFHGSRWATERGRDALRNAAVTTVAPTGTISIIAGTTSGIEPLYAVAFVRNVLGGEELLEVNPIFEAEARRRGFYSTDLLRRVLREGTVQRIDAIPKDVRDVFVTAADVQPEWHVRIQAAFQRHTDAGVSKTVNLPFEATQAEVRRVYRLAHQLGCKGITVFRSGSRSEQVLAQKDTAPGPGECRACGD